MRIKTGFWTTIFGLLLVTAFGVYAQTNTVCPVDVQGSYTATEFLCETVADGQACIGNGTVNTTPIEGSVITFANPGELAPLAQIQRLQVQTLGTETQSWTTVTGNLEASTRDGEDAVVDMLVFGDAVVTNATATEETVATADVLPATIEAAGGVIIRQDANVASNNIWQLVNGEQVQAIGRSADNQWIRVIIPSPNGGAGWVFAQFVDVESGRELLPFHTNASPIPAVSSATQEVSYKPMQSFRLESVLTDPACAETTDSGVMLQSQNEDGRVVVEVNGVELRMRGTVFITAQVGDQMTIYNLEGETAVIANDERVDLTLATFTEIPMDASLAPTDQPSDVTPYSQELADLFTFLPIRLLTRNIEIQFIDPSLTADTSTDESTDTTTTEQQDAPPPPAPTDIPPQTDEEPIDPSECPTLVQESYTAAEFVCETVSPSTACIGNIGSGIRQSVGREGVEDFTFTSPADTVNTTDIEVFETTVFGDPERTWNSIVMKLDADTTTGATAEATILTFGELRLENTGGAVPADTTTAPPATDTTTETTTEPTVQPPPETEDTTTATTGTPAAIQAAGGIIVRAQPRVDAETVGQLQNADPVTALGRSVDQQWIQVQSTDGTITGWVFVQFVAVDGGIENLPTIDPNAEPTVPSPPATNNATTETTTDTTADTTTTDTTADTSAGVPGAIQAAGDIVVRAEPRVDTDSVGQLASAAPVTVLARSVDQQWIQVQSTDGTITGWVFAQFVAVDGGIEELPIVDPSTDNTAPPPPPATNNTTTETTTDTSTNTTAPPPPPAGGNTTTTTTTGETPEYTSMQSFEVSTLEIDRRCEGAHPSGVMIQSPDDMDGKMRMQVNGIDLAISGTIFVQAEINVETTFMILEGEVDVTAQGETQTAEAGELTSVQMIDNLSPNSPPSLPSDYSYGKGRNLPNLPIRLLPRNFEPIVPPEPADTNVVDEADSGDGVTPLGDDVVSVGGTIVDFDAECEVSAGGQVRNLRADAGPGFDVINTLQPGQSITAVSQKRGTDNLYWYETSDGWIRQDAGVTTPDCENLPLFGVIYDASSVGGDVSSVAPAAPPPPPQPTAVPPPPLVSSAFANICDGGGGALSVEIEQGGLPYVEFDGTWTGQAGTSVTFSADIPYFRPELGNVLTFVNEDGSQWLGSLENTTFTINFDTTRTFRVRVAGLVGDFITLRVNCNG